MGPSAHDQVRLLHLADQSIFFGLSYGTLVRIWTHRAVIRLLFEPRRVNKVCLLVLELSCLPLGGRRKFSAFAPVFRNVRRRVNIGRVTKTEIGL